jgi:RNA-directed DNA polymerase
MHALDLFVRRDLSCRACLRYVGDPTLFSDSKSELWAWKAALRNRLAQMRLVMHERATQVAPTAAGTPWLGFVFYPEHTLVKARKVRQSMRP